MGDLNYRIVKGAIDDDTVMQMIEDKQYMELADYDQLQQQRERNKVFEDFNEGLRLFPPTYKYDVGTVDYDFYNSKKKRCPAWCDRILWRTTASIGQNDDTAWEDDPRYSSHNDATWLRRARRAAIMKGRRHYHADLSSNGLPCEDSTGVNLLAYNASYQLLMSDHMAVYGAFNIRVRRMDWAKRERLLLNMHRAAGELLAPNDHFIMYGSGLGQAQEQGKGMNMMTIYPSHFSLSSDNQESVNLQLQLRSNFPIVATEAENVVVCGVLAYTLPPWLSVGPVAPALNEVDKVIFEAAKGANEPQWIDLCVLRAGQEAKVPFTLDCVKAISEYGIESFKQEARLKDGANTLRHSFGGATNEAEVLRGAEMLLKANGEDRAEVCATVCIRCRKVPRGDGAELFVGKPLDFYLPVTLHLGQAENNN